MTDREKLIELFAHDDCPIFMVFGDNMDGLADYLIRNGVTIPVRCSDCKSWETDGCSDGQGWCPKVFGYRRGDWYCAAGERKDDGK